MFETINLTKPDKNTGSFPWIQDKATPEEVVGLAGRVEGLLTPCGCSQTVAEATTVRKHAAWTLGKWSHTRFLAESGSIDRLLENGDLQAARTAAQRLVQHCLDAGEEAYPGASYDIAMAHMRLGRELKNVGATEAALQPLAEARRRFETLADAGDTNAEYMASTAITERAAYLTALGRLDEAAAAYEEVIRCQESLGDERAVAANKNHLATVRVYQKRYSEALEIYTEARDIFERLGELGSVGVAWHQIGMVHRLVKQFGQAEQAYRQELAISVRQKYRAGEAPSLRELGNLYDDMGRLEEAVAFHRRSADVYAELQNLYHEGVVRNNLAGTLIKLGRYGEARRELHRTIECNESYGHAAELRKTRDLLHNLEEATGNPEAPAQARQRAMQRYPDRRRAGRESRVLGTKLRTLVAGMNRFKGLFEALGLKIPLATMRLYWFRHESILNSMTEMGQFRDYVMRVQPQVFLRYERVSPRKRLGMQSMVCELGLNLRGIRFLDIGPGYGDSLDICYEKGARDIGFVDIDPFFFAYNRLKGFTKGYRMNHITGLSKLDPGKYDVIFSKGAISADAFIAVDKLKIEKLSLSRWLTEVERLASPLCQIIICPHWSNDTRKRNIVDVQHTMFTETMIDQGYVILPKIKSHNHEPEYPLTFYKACFL